MRVSICRGKAAASAFQHEFASVQRANAYLRSAATHLRSFRGLALEYCGVARVSCQCYHGLSSCTKLPLHTAWATSQAQQVTSTSAAHRRFADGLDILTVEIEHIDAEALDEVASHLTVEPEPATLRIIQVDAYLTCLQAHACCLSRFSAIGPALDNCLSSVCSADAGVPEYLPTRHNSCLHALMGTVGAVCRTS